MRTSFIFLISVILLSCQTPGRSSNATTNDEINESVGDQDFSNLDTATFAGGCFWCVEASFDQIEGVVEAVSGYAGGKKSTADYKMVSSGRTKHAETVEIYYDADKISYETLLDIFFTAHDPTQLNRQGPDKGPQYRTAIFYHNQMQREEAAAKIKEIQPSYNQPIVTELNEYTAFYKAEDYHQDYEEKHPYDSYIMNVSRPKIDRVKEKFADILKEEYK